MPEPDHFEAELAKIRKAVRGYCHESTKTLVRKVVVRMQRITASGIFGDDYGHKTLWDEYCHEVQQRPHEPIEMAWAHTIDGFIQSVAAVLPHHEGVILTIGAMWEMEEDDQLLGLVCLDCICRYIKKMVNRLAAERDISRFDPRSSA